VFEGNTAGPAAFTEIAGVVHDTFQLKKMVMAGDRGMITSARIEALRELDGKYAWITALRAPAIRKLMDDGGPLQLSLSDEQDLAEITSPDFPGERLVACRNPALAGERARKREALLAATEKLLAPLIARVQAGRLAGAAGTGKKAGEVTGKYKMARHFEVTITDTSLTVERKQAQIEEEARLDGIYVIRTPVPDGDLDAAGAVTACKNLKYVERDFRHIKSGDLDLRPVFHRLVKRVKGHVLICMLAACPGLAPAPGPGAAHLHRRGPPAAGQPRRARPAPGIGPGQGLTPARPGRTPLPQLPRTARPPGHPYPQRAALRRHPRHRPRPGRAHQRTTPGLRAHRGGHPAHPAQVVRNRRQARRGNAGQQRSRHPNHP
jgi:hypothetical protein